MASITYSTHFHLGASSVPRTLLVSTKSPPQSEGSAQFSAPPWALPCPVLFCLFLYCSLDRLTDTGGWSRWVRTLLAVCGEYREEGCSGSRRKAILFSENSCLRYFHDWWCLFVCDGCVYGRVVGSWGPNQIKDVETKSFPKKLHICTTHNSKKKYTKWEKAHPHVCDPKWVGWDIMLDMFTWNIHQAPHTTQKNKIPGIFVARTQEFWWINSGWLIENCCQ